MSTATINGKPRRARKKSQAELNHEAGQTRLEAQQRDNEQREDSEQSESSLLRVVSENEDDKNTQAENVTPIEETEAYKKALQEAALMRAKAQEKQYEASAAERRAEELQRELEEEKKKVKYPEDPRPGPYLVAHSYDWITAGSEMPTCEGFSIKVRTSLTNFERRKLGEWDRWLQGEYTEKWENTPEDQRGQMDSPLTVQREKLAQYIYDWNAIGTDFETGEPKPLPPPREAGPDVFDAISDDEYSWLVYVVIGGYTVLGKAGPWRNKLKRTGFTKRGADQQ